jgi:hypothetical protein
MENQEHEKTYTRLLTQFLSQREFQKQKPEGIELERAGLFVITQSLYEMQVPLSSKQIQDMFSLLTIDQLKHINDRIDQGQHWF